MDVECPNCGSDKLRFSRVRNIRERIRTFAGYHPLRCKECKTRFVGRIWQLSNWKYARCPRCYRMELTTWSEDHYNAGGMIAVMLSLGARRYRCGACRHNFASFRPRRQQVRDRPVKKAEPTAE